MGRRTNTAAWNGKRWRIDVQKDGTRKSFYSSKPGRTGQREANAKADAWLDEGIYPRGARVEDLYLEWYAVQQETTSAGNCQNIASRWKVWVLPRIGCKRITSLTEQDLQGIINQAYAAGRSKKTLQSLCADLRAFCKYAGAGHGALNRLLAHIGRHSDELVIQAYQVQTTVPGGTTAAGVAVAPITVDDLCPTGEDAGLHCGSKPGCRLQRNTLFFFRHSIVLSYCVVRFFFSEKTPSDVVIQKDGNQYQNGPQQYILRANLPH